MTEITSKYAGFWPRLLAHNIDLLPILVLYYIASLIIPPSDYDYIFMAGIYFSYHILFELSPMQATPGKRWAKIKVVSEREAQITLTQSVARNVFKLLSLILFFGGFFAIFFNSKRKALHDYIGDSLVLFDED